MTTELERDELAGHWMARGIAAMGVGTPVSLRAALSCFDEAIRLRESLRFSENPWFAYNLAGSWLNRADALARLADVAPPAGALAACDRALAILRALPPQDDPRFARRHALACLNRCAAVLATGAAAEWRAVAGLCAEARRVLDAAIAPVESAALLRASAWASQARAHTRLGEGDEARRCARRALALTASAENRDAAVATTALHARHALCESAARLLEIPPRAEARETALAEALDAAEDGLALARCWPEDARLRLSARELFRFAAQTYARRQPQFLGELLRENLAQPPVSTDAACRPIAAQAVATALGAAADRGFAALATPHLAPTLALLRELRAWAAALASPAGDSQPPRFSPALEKPIGVGA